MDGNVDVVNLDVNTPHCYLKCEFSERVTSVFADRFEGAAFPCWSHKSQMLCFCA